MIGHGPGTTAPSASLVGSSMLRRVLLPATVLWVAVVGTGFLIVDVIGLDERAVSDAFVDARTTTFNGITAVVSEMGNTQVLIATCLVIVAFIWWQSRQWWFAVVPALALGVEAVVFLTSSLVVGRSRPEVEQLDHAPPTSSFPSGHTGASTAVYLAFARHPDPAHRPARHRSGDLHPGAHRRGRVPRVPRDAPSVGCDRRIRRRCDLCAHRVELAPRARRR